MKAHTVLNTTCDSISVRAHANIFFNNLFDLICLVRPRSRWCGVVVVVETGWLPRLPQRRPWEKSCCAPRAPRTAVGQSLRPRHFRTFKRTYVPPALYLSLLDELHIFHLRSRIIPFQQTRHTSSRNYFVVRWTVSLLYTKPKSSDWCALTQYYSIL